MQAAINLITASWRIFQSSKNAPKQEAAVPKKSSGKTQHWPFRSNPAAHTDRVGHEEPVFTGNSALSSWVNITTPTANRADGDIYVQRDDTSRPSDNFREPRSLSLQPTYTNDLLSVLEMQRDTNERLLQQALDSNTLTHSLFSNIETLVYSLQSCMHKAEDFSTAIDLPNEHTTMLQGLQRELQALINVDLPRCKTSQENLVISHRDNIESMMEINRKLDRVLKSKPADSSRNLSPEPALSPTENLVDLGDVLVARSPSVVQYLSRLGDIDSVREKLTDLRLERAQLLDEQKTRERFGLSLDEESLDFLSSFQDREERLLEELEHANVMLEALTQLVHDEEALRVTNEAYNNDNDTLWDVSPQLGTNTTSTPGSYSGMRDEESVSFLWDLQTEMPTITDLYVTGDTDTSDSARFINAWLLGRAQSQPGLLSKFTSAFEHYYAPPQSEDPLSLFLGLWFDDSTAIDYQQSRTDADKQSMRANRANSQDPVGEGASSLTSQTDPIPLLTLGPGTKAEDIIAHAIRARGGTPSQDPG